LFNENFDIKPKIAPAGQIFVQKNLFLKNTKAKTAKVIINPKRLKLTAEPKIVYGSTCLISIADPLINAPKDKPKIKYLNPKFPCKEFFFFLRKNAKNSCKIPNGHRIEQYNLPNITVNPAMIVNNTAAAIEKSQINR